MVCTFIDTLCKYATCIMRSLRRSSWCYWSAVDWDGRATVVEVGWRRCCLEDCWECCSSLRCAVQWSPMKPESWSGWFPLKSSPTCSCRWLHCDLQNVRREHPNYNARTQRANWSESSSWQERLPVSLSWCLEADPLVDTAHNNSCIVAIVGYHGNSVYLVVTWILMQSKFPEK
jgi:hypothetical protein